MAIDNGLSPEDQRLLEAIGQLRREQSLSPDLHQRIMDAARQTPLPIPPTGLPERVMDSVSRYVGHARRRLSSADLYGLVSDAVLSAEMAAQAGFRTRPAASSSAEITVIDRLSPFTLVASAWSYPAFPPELMAWQRMQPAE
ncbi:MAG: hypothetical protein ETSY2_53940 [Candidatus Entotheonella gemina]|uniref:Uncharacterized protein n=1 Tax=Candidatus Entotheonella gemina TaxID=1429439 RepID=W4L3N5_9BACT|nr:MAG: hypothetical protein ETSY2_53940 [Candidatus Entotheonella gemina]